VVLLLVYRVIVMFTAPSNQTNDTSNKLQMSLYSLYLSNNNRSSGSNKQQTNETTPTPTTTLHLVYLETE